MPDSFKTPRVYRQMLLGLLRLSSRPTLFGAEIGVGCGGTSAMLLREFHDLTLYMVDPWSTHPETSAYRKTGDRRARMSQEENERRFQGSCAAVEFAGPRAAIMRLRSVEAAKRVQDDSLDFVFIDGSHAYEDVRDDIAAWWPKVKSGGLFCGHDYSSGPDANQKFSGVQRAVDEFFSKRQLPFSRHDCSLWWVDKP